ncbi:penicillin-binding protein 1C [Enterovirga rhinocerotis]|uniref:peptidoglycan glycosyltransferase n=1 Tax=Enterovirga rhinocerotis TaxID=1339210 RepID=A0A4R7BIQ6_9HYPH|nr:penicillin-binding protein 1C [Enterovirga rhinocerotis]
MAHRAHHPTPDLRSDLPPPGEGEGATSTSPHPAAPRGEGRRRWLRFAIAVGVAAVLVAGAGSFALWRVAASMPPLDLTEAEQRSTVVLDRHGLLLRAFATPEGRWRLPVSREDVDPRFLAMLKAYEDKRFDSHRGLDALAVARAGWQLVWNGRVVSGASTLTMQVARLLEPRAERSLAAKLRQAIRAVELERRFSKGELLDLYLRLAPYGGTLEGVRAASLSYFGKEPKRLSVAEAALLVALPQSPEARRPDRSAQTARRARDRVLDRLLAGGALTRAEVEEARAERVPSIRRGFPMHAAHAAEKAVAERPDLAVHRLTIDRRRQVALETLLAERIGRFGDQVSGAIVVIDNETGEVRARIGSPAKLSTERRGAIDMTAAYRSPGSALKPFVYGLAFESGIAHPETLVDDRPSRYGAYGPENFDLTFQGTVTARHALQMSLNVPAVELLSAVGPARFIARLRQGGASILLPAEAAPGLATGLGGLGVSLLDLTRLYVGFARGGLTPPLVTRLEPDAKVATGEGRITDPVPAWYVADILRGAPPPENAASGRIAFKTGTSYGYRDAWAIGFDRKVTVGVWLGRADGGSVPGLVGRVAAAPILFDAYSRLGEEPEPVPKPPGVLVATTGTLPPPLRHIRQDVPKTIAATVQAPLRIAFPLEGSRVDLGASRSAGPEMALALKASGGVPPMIWLVNGQPLGDPDPRRQSSWMPDGAGFARVSVMDARGATDSVVVRIE